jgi:hypothetical protein
MDKDTLIEKLYSIVNWQKKMDHSDPDYLFIAELVEDIPDDRLSDYYLFVNTTKKYHSPAGALLRFKIKDSVDDYIQKLKKEVWKKYGLEQKKSVLKQKIYSLAHCTKEIPAERKKTFLDRDNILQILYITASGEKEPLFDKEDQEILRHQGLEYLVDQCTAYGIEALESDIDLAIKTFFYKKYIYEETEKPKIVKIASL